MKSSQYSIKVFETDIEDEKQFISFMDANYELFKNHLISIKGSISDEIVEYLKSKNLVFVNDITLPRSKGSRNSNIQPKPLAKEAVASKQEEPKKEASKQEKAQPKVEQKQPLKIIDKALRSGQTIEHNGDVLLFERINSGAKVMAEGSILALNLVDGDLVSNGDFIIIPESKKTNILFHGVMIDTILLKHKLNKIALKDNKITIESVYKKELTWV